MKLLRYGPPGQEKPGLLDTAGKIRDLSSVVSDIADDSAEVADLARGIQQSWSFLARWAVA